MHLFQTNRSLSELSTFGIGGAARYFTEVQTIEQLQETIRYCKREKLPFFILGKGSNSLFDDRGFDGLIIQMKIGFCTMGEEEVSVGAGYSFSLLGVQTARKGFSGLEFASGIPASVGGAIFMNAGANGQEVGDLIKEVTFIDEEGNCEIFPREKMLFSYRHSCFQEKKGAIAAAKFRLIPSLAARKKQLEIIDYRTKTQPYGDKSCGCVFRNPLPEKAGALIEKCGLKGVRIGGAEVSTLHANFIVNKEKATAKDVLALAFHIKECVKRQTGIELEMEIRSVPFNETFSS